MPLILEGWDSSCLIPDISHVCLKRQSCVQAVCVPFYHNRFIMCLSLQTAAQSRTAQPQQLLTPAFQSRCCTPALQAMSPKLQLVQMTTRACCPWMLTVFSRQTHSTWQRWRSPQVGSSSSCSNVFISFLSPSLRRSYQQVTQWK